MLEVDADPTEVGLDPDRAGLAHTAFYVDPAEEITAMFFTQLLPGPVYPLRTLVTQAVVA
jgi:hypothetical protein